MLLLLFFLFFVLPFVYFVCFHTRDPERHSRSDSYVINLAASPPSFPKFEISAPGANSWIYGTEY